jgi:hypothetical protein
MAGRSKHNLAGRVEGNLAFRITEVSIQFASHAPARRRRMNVNRNVLYLIIGGLAIAVGVLSYQLHQAKKQPEGFQINVGPDGLKIQGK